MSTNKLRDTQLAIAKKNKTLITVDEYLSLYGLLPTLKQEIDYLKSITVARPGKEHWMLKFNEEYDWVPGGSFYNGYGRASITDYREYKSCKGRKRVQISANSYDYVDSPDMHDLVSEPLKTTEQVILDKIEYNRKYIYSFGRKKMIEIEKVYKDQLIIYIGGQACSDSKLSQENLDKVISGLTPQEYAIYIKNVYKIDISLYPTIEFPVRIRIDGSDDGAEEVFVSGVESAKKILIDLSLMNSKDRRNGFGFQSTD